MAGGAAGLILPRIRERLAARFGEAVVVEDGWVAVRALGYGLLQTRPDVWAALAAAGHVPPAAGLPRRSLAALSAAPLSR